MASYSDIRHDRPGGGGSSGITVGTTTVTGGGDNRVLYMRAGIVRADAKFAYDDTLDAVTSGDAAVDLGAIGFGGGHVGRYQAKESHNGGLWFYAENYSGGAGARSGFAVNGSGGNIGKFEAHGSGFTGSLLGTVMAGYVALEAQEEMAIGSTGAFPVLFGAANAEYFRMDGTGGTGVRYAKAITMTPVELAGAAIAATSTVGLGNYHFSALGGSDRAHTLVARSSVVKGYRVTYSLVDTGDGNKVTLTRNGTDTILGGTATYDLNTDRESVTFEASGTNDWIVL